MICHYRFLQAVASFPNPESSESNLLQNHSVLKICSLIVSLLKIVIFYNFYYSLS